MQKNPIPHTKIKSSKDNKGYTTIYSTITLNGEKKRIRKRVKEEEAEEVIDYWQNMLLKGFNPLDEKAEREYQELDEELTLAQAVDKYMSSSLLTRGTIYNIENKMTPFVKEFGDYKLSSITSIQVEKIIIDKIKNKRWTQSTVKNAKNVFSSFFNWCVRARFITENPTHFMNRKITSDKDAPERYNPYSDEDFKLVLDAVKKSENKYLYLYICFIYHASLRPKEARLLKVGDLNFKKNIITVRSSIAKNDKKAIVPIFPSLRKVLLEYGIDKKEADDFVFMYNSPRHFAMWFDQIIKNLNLSNKGYSIYCFKHTSNVHKMLKHGWTPAQIQKFNRHSSIEMTMNYLKKLVNYTSLENVDSPDI